MKKSASSVSFASGELVFADGLMPSASELIALFEMSSLSGAETLALLDEVRASVAGRRRVKIGG